MEETQGVVGSAETGSPSRGPSLPSGKLLLLHPLIDNWLLLGIAYSIAVMTRTIEDIKSVVKAKPLIEVSYWRKRSWPNRVTAVQGTRYA